MDRFGNVYIYSLFILLLGILYQGNTCGSLEILYIGGVVVSVLTKAQNH